MKLGNIGEFGFIERFAPMFMKNIPEGTLGIGDDCAVIPLSSGDGGLCSAGSVFSDRDGGLNTEAALSSNEAAARNRGPDSEELYSAPELSSPGSQHKENTAGSGDCLLVTTDLLLENVHFLKDRISAEDLGYKSLAVNLSDIAAMGGTPLFAFLSIALPKDTQISWTDDFFKGFNRLASETGTLLMGGDTTGSKEGIVINVAVIGKSDLSRVKYRSGAKPGDFVCISGITGESAAGLQIVLDSSLEQKADSMIIKNLLRCHNAPRPHVKEGLFLSGEEGVHAMMDVSDGIDSDLRHIMKKSHCSAEVDLDDFPLNENLKAAEKELEIDPYLSALSGGEDYCLLLSVDPGKYDDINRRFENHFKHPLYKIGRMFSSDAVAEDGSGINFKNDKSGADENYKIDENGKKIKFKKIRDKGKAEINTSGEKNDSSNRLVYLKDNKPIGLTKRGFDHFSS